ncbi:hypothetical protein EV669_11135 [Gulbenkiania mobilis]|uniref:Uncharacterized protein n=1 Tax=Gulbenkiania mobilis TaxID=397457 RepID=A0ABY2CX46_GULMO|nr:hypothetical protein EV669_11135 [Gulbenkiania mobilis]
MRAYLVNAAPFLPWLNASLPALLAMGASLCA